MIYMIKSIIKERNHLNPNYYLPIALMSSKRNQLKTVKAKTLDTKDRKYYWKIK